MLIYDSTMRLMIKRSRGNIDPHLRGLRNHARNKLGHLAF